MNLPPPWNTVKFVGSCIGLVCLARPPYLTVRTFICNPITREYVRLPEINKYSDDAYWTCGYGYAASTNEYKVVAIMSTEFEEVFVYTLGSGKGWRNLGKFKIGESTYDWELGVFANGALYWKDIELGMITAFDLAEEKFFKKISPPPLPRDTHWHCHELRVLDGVLFFAMYLVVRDAEFFDIWLLKKKNDNQDKKQGKGSASKKNKKRKGNEHPSLGWSKEFRVKKSQLVSVTRSAGVLNYTDNCLNICNTKASTSKRLVDFKELACVSLPRQKSKLYCQLFQLVWLMLDSNVSEESCDAYMR
ncbi:uncharacterized protein LOC113331608 [Papaver somniferum]|uniref:uncharacterized protein LOC113331608 n=1 Tax=Papaver somniferum TaxID=3469 RepID=UPI000E70062A|nr:uncharacterized protein LOC113331608 [Papaver somniferum]